MQWSVASKIGHAQGWHMGRSVNGQSYEIYKSSETPFDCTCHSFTSNRCFNLTRSRDHKPTVYEDVGEYRHNCTDSAAEAFGSAKGQHVNLSRMLFHFLQGASGYSHLHKHPGAGSSPPLLDARGLQSVDPGRLTESLWRASINCQAEHACILS